ncbi:MAG: hypothetical protein CME70_24485 [Halobacteriovorax sp.]|nr:hypothetical protein [Halobacteriovorax sp.]|tara:strand:- start:6259 stop:6588 length:330 start_codon:yes stop_codon:yes gene_type:complete
MADSSPDLGSDFDPEDLNQFNIPTSFLDQLVEFTGADDTSRGYILSYVDQYGNPMVLSRFSTQIIEMGLRKALEKYLIQAEESEAGQSGPGFDDLSDLDGSTDIDDELN